jgi:hypothetical protein
VRQPLKEASWLRRTYFLKRKTIQKNVINTCSAQIKSRIAMAKAAFNNKKNLFTSKLDLNLRKKLVKCYIWSIALYGAETWTLGN